MANDNNPASQQQREADRLIYAGLLGLAVATIIQLVDKGDLNTAQSVMVYAFAVAIPLLAVGLVTDYARRAGTYIPPWREAVGVVGALASVTGLAALFFHFGVGFGVVFLAVSAAGIVLVRRL